MGKKELKTVLLAGLYGFYVFIMLYIFFAIIHIEKLQNFEVAAAYQIIEFAALAYFLFGQILCGAQKTGYFIPLIFVTILYMAAVDAVNFACVALLPPVFFFLIHMLVLFFYCLISVPMYIMGRNN